MEYLKIRDDPVPVWLAVMERSAQSAPERTGALLDVDWADSHFRAVASINCRWCFAPESTWTSQTRSIFLAEFEEAGKYGILPKIVLAYSKRDTGGLLARQQIIRSASPAAGSDRRSTSWLTIRAVRWWRSWDPVRVETRRCFRT